MKRIVSIAVLISLVASFTAYAEMKVRLPQVRRVADLDNCPENATCVDGDGNMKSPSLAIGSVKLNDANPQLWMRDYNLHSQQFEVDGSSAPSGWTETLSGGGAVAVSDGVMTITDPDSNVQQVGMEYESLDTLLYFPYDRPFIISLDATVAATNKLSIALTPTTSWFTFTAAPADGKFYTASAGSSNTSELFENIDTTVKFKMMILMDIPNSRVRFYAGWKDTVDDSGHIQEINSDTEWDITPTTYPNYLNFL